MTLLDLLTVAGWIVGLAVAVLFCVALWQRAALRAYLIRKLGLFSLPITDVNRIPERAKDYQALKDNVTLGGVVAGAVAWMAWVNILHDWLTPLVVCAVIAALVICAWFFVVLMYSRRYVSKTALEATVHDTYTDEKGQSRWRRITDHWGIEAPEPLKPDDPRLVEARRVVYESLEIWRRHAAELDEEAAETPAADPAPDPATPSAPAVPAPSPPPQPGVRTEAATQTLYCGDCGVTIPNLTTDYCGHCGATLYPEEHFYLIRRAFCDPADPWYQFLVYADCDINQHWNPATARVYMGKIPVDMPCSKVSFVKVENIIPGEKLLKAGVTEQSLPAAGLPVVMFVDSKENLERVRGQHRMATSNPSHIALAEDTFDGYLCVSAASTIRTLEKTVTSLRAALDRSQAEGGNEAARMIDIDTRLGTPPPPPKPKYLTPKVKRILKWLVILGVGGAIAAAVVLVGIPLALQLLWGGLVLAW